MANSISLDGKLLGAGGMTAFGATAQAAVASTAITAVGSTSLTAADLTSLNGLITRVEAMRVLQDRTRTDLINAGIQKGAI